MDFGEILFKFHVDTAPGEHVRVVGDHEKIGSWDPLKGFVLGTSPEIYPYWISNEILLIPRDAKISFKCVIMKGDAAVRWEEQLLENRKYKVTHKKVILRGVFNEEKSSEIVEEEFSDKIKVLTTRSLLNYASNFDPLSGANKSESEVDSGDLLSTKLLMKKFQRQEESKNNEEQTFNIADNQNIRNNDDVIGNNHHNNIQNSHNNNNNNNNNNVQNNNNNNNNNTGESDEYDEEEGIQEEMTDLSKMKNIVNLTSTQKNYLEQYNQFCEPNSLFSPIFLNNAHKETLENQILDKDSIFQSYFKQMKENNQLKSIYTKLNSNNDIMYELNQDIIHHLDDNIPIILASLFLPVNVQINDSGDYAINLFQSNFNSILFHLLNETKDNIYKRRKFEWIGFLPYNSSNEKFSLYKQNLLLEELHDRYNLTAVLIDETKLFDFIKNFYNQYFENIISNIVEEDYTQVFNFSEERWNFFKEINKLIASKILSKLEDNTLVYIIDYRIFLSVGMISYNSSKTSIGLFWDHSFPTLENFKYLPFKHEMLLSILCANVICFLDFRYARSFFSVAKSFLGLDYQTNRGVLYILYLGRQIIIKISSQIPDFSTVIKRQKSEKYIKALEKWKERFGDADIVLAINSLDILNLTILKFELIHDFVEAKRNKHRIKFVQVIQKETYDELIEYSNNKTSIKEIYKLQNDMNTKFGEDIFIVIEEKLSTEEYLALMNIAKVFLRAQIKPKNLFKCLEFLLSNNDYSVVMISEFACYSKLCKSFVTFNLFKKTDFIDKLDSILTMDTRETLRCNTLIDHEYFKENSSLTWLDNCLLDLLQTSNMIKYAQISSISMGLQYLKVLTNKRFKHLDGKLTLNNYKKKSTNRLIIFDVEGTLLPQDKYSHFESKKNKSTTKLFQSLDDQVLTNIRWLTQDNNNTVFLITGKGLEEFSSYFKLPGLGLACEYGYLLKDCAEKHWIRLCQLDLSWKEKAKKIIQRFVDNTELSLMIEKESAIVWKYGDVDKEMGAKQCEQLHKELREHFENNQEIDIVISKDYLEVRPFGMNKGTFTEILIKKIYEEKGKIDFILIIGNGLSDEEMFVAAKKNLKLNPERFAPKTAPYLCVVGKRPSNAFYYVKDHVEVTKLIESFVEETDLNI